eukprot:4817057-Pyramimonas_sp.AAC.1
MSREALSAADLGALDAATRSVRAIEGPFAIAADSNVEPRGLAVAGFMQQVAGGAVSPPAGAARPLRRTVDHGA